MDTITALATASGLGGIGVIRISGSESLSILQQIFRTVHGAQRSVWRHRKLYLGYIVDPLTQERLDNVLAVFMRQPHTYTGDDTVEISHHGGQAVAAAILDLIRANGARLAEPGEFTKRAFLNGRMDLTQAEAVGELIHAKGEWARRLAFRQLEGGLKHQVYEVRRNLMEARVVLEAAVDFPEEDIPGLELQLVKECLHTAVAGLTHLITTSRESRALKTGFRVVLLGNPNVGKSSLMNRLLGEDRVIVDQLPGTTRDSIDAEVAWDGLTIRLVDTAGLREDGDRVEAEGIKRGLHLAQQAELLLVVIDSGVPLEPSFFSRFQLWHSIPTLVLLNKADLPAAVSEHEVPKGLDRIWISCKTGSGIQEVKQRIAVLLQPHRELATDELIVASPRHQEILENTLVDVTRAEQSLQDAVPPELVAADVTTAMANLGKITGETTPDDVLDVIFSRFCIGK